MEGIRKRALFCQKWYVKWLGVGPRGGSSSYETLLSTPSPRPGLYLKASQATTLVGL